MFKLIFALWLSGSALAVDVMLPLSGTKVNMDWLTKVSSMTLPEMAAELRKQHRVKVLVTPLLTAKKTENAELRGVALEEDQAAIREIAKVLFPSRNTTVVSAFLPPHSVLDRSTYVAGKGFPPRPLAEHPVIVLTGGAEKTDLLHELVHFLIWKSQSPRTMDLHGKKVAAADYHHVAKLTALQWMTYYEQRAADPKLGAADSDLLRLGHEKWTFYFWEHALHESRAKEEEVDIAYLFRLNQKALGIPAEQIVSHLRYLADINRELAIVSDECNSIVKNQRYLKDKGSDDDRLRLKTLPAAAEERRKKLVRAYEEMRSIDADLRGLPVKP